MLTGRGKLAEHQCDELISCLFDLPVVLAVAVGAGERLSVRLHHAETPREIRICGADTGVSTGARLCLHAVHG